jgi:hypothetical protein
MEAKDAPHGLDFAGNYTRIDPVSPIEYQF